MRRKSFRGLHKLLRDVEDGPDNLHRILRLNRLILRETLKDEAALLRHRSALRTAIRRKKAGGRRSDMRMFRRQIRRLEGRIDDLLQQIFIWKCFGDGLAFHYLDKFSVKHAFYDTDSTAAKQSSGMLTGKSGLKGELAVLSDAIAKGVPAVLSDLTNVVRHGDVCLLGGSDPYLLEVKSSSRLNERGRRQLERLAKLHEFLKKDSAEHFRGLGPVRRSIMSVPERTHIAALNECIVEAERKGSCVVHPEPGLAYAAIYRTDEPLENILPEPTGRQMVYMLNAAKSARKWGIYYPFTLSIREEQHLFDFVVGELTLLVFFDVDTLCRAMTKPGWIVAYKDGDPDYVVHCRHASGAEIRVSRQFVDRIGYDFVSPTWVAECHAPDATLLEIERHFIGGATKPTA